MVSPKAQYLVHCFFSFYVNGLPKITDENSKIVLFTYDTSIIINSPNPIHFKNNVNKIFQSVLDGLVLIYCH
jgi:hypothetical protein